MFKEYINCYIINSIEFNLGASMIMTQMKLLLLIIIIIQILNNNNNNVDYRLCTLKFDTSKVGCYLSETD